ncbi:hypothetical protein VSR82_07710 [Burkholderia sp. JPY481]
MSTLPYCAKQATAMAEFATDRAQAKLDAAIDAEESRDELIAARKAELIQQRMAAMTADDVQAGLQSCGAGLAAMLSESLRKGDHEMVGIYVRSLIGVYIEQDSEVMANDWMDRIDRELAQWEH